MHAHKHTKAEEKKKGLKKKSAVNLVCWETAAATFTAKTTLKY